MQKAAFIVLLIFSLHHTQAQYHFKSLQLSDSVETRYHGSRAFSDGSFAAIGILQDETDTLQTTSHMVLTKLNCMGQIMWSKRLGFSGGVNNTNGTIVEADNGDIVFTYNLAVGWFEASMLVGRFTQDGDMVWLKNIGLNEEYGRGITKTNDGGFVVVGSTGIFGLDNARSDIYMIKLDSDGNVMWNKTWGNFDAFDDAYTVIEDSEGNLLTVGRYIENGGFYGFMLKTDPLGNQIFLKGYGQVDHRTFAFDIKETPEGEYLMSGYTTIAKDDWQSNGDAFLLKTNKDGGLVWAKIYEPTQSDRNDFAFSIVLEDDGDYGLILESSSFSIVGGPQAPNKQVVYSVTNVGDIKQVTAFNPKGSQYSKMTKAPDGGYFITGFSTYYNLTGPNVAFEPTAFKTDADYFSGASCEQWDRTSFVVTTELPWDVPDLPSQSTSGIRIRDYNIITDDGHDRSEIICQDFPELESEILPVGGPFCIGDPIDFIANSQGNIVDWIWDYGDDSMDTGRETSHAFDSIGEYHVVLATTDGCRTIYDTVVVQIEAGSELDLVRQICPGDTLNFRDSVITDAGNYTFYSSSQAKCDTVIRLNVSLLSLDTLVVEKPLCNGKSFSFMGLEIDSAGEYSFRTDGAGVCDSLIFLKVLNDVQDTIMVEEDVCPETPYTKGNVTLNTAIDTIFQVFGPYCDTVYHVILSEGDDCECEPDYPNAFTPNQDGQNDVFVGFNNDCSPVSVREFKIRIYNRWGQQVFESEDPNEAWNGTFEGEDCPQEVYLVSYQYRFGDIFRSENTDVTLIR